MTEAVPPIGTQFSRLAAVAPDEPAVTCDGRTLTRGELENSTNRLARAYADRGVGVGDYVTIALPNSIEWIQAALATWKLGAVPRPLSPRLPEPEFDALMQLRPRALIVGRISSESPSLPMEFTPYPDLSDGPLPEAVSPTWKALASGVSTGRPKLIEAGGDSRFAATIFGQMMAQRVIDLAGGDPTMGDLFVGSPLALAIALRGCARYCVGIAGWKADLEQAVAMARAVDPTTYALSMAYKYGLTIPDGGQLPTATAVRETAEAVQIAEQSGDDLALTAARLARGLALAHRPGPEREAGFEMLANVREMATQQRLTMTAVSMADIQIAREKARLDDIDGAIDVAHSVIDDLLNTGEMISCGPATTVLVESLLTRGADGDLHEAQAAIDRLAAIPTDPGFVLHELPLLRLRALLARAFRDEGTYREFADRYRKMATELGFEGHMAITEAMT